uniref:TorF family putative porin n=1 Tax=Polynucleobacter sp. TaxID=2029855 RepID=UPI0040483658
MKTIKKTALSAVAATLLSGLAVQSAFAADAPEVSPISANVTVVNEYRYRGIAQSNFLPAIQGGFDYAHDSGLYIGNWNSSISWVSDASTVSAPIEMDFYAGFKKDLIAEGFASDIGVLQYYYPMSGGSAVTTNPNTTEIYAAQNFTFGPVTGFAKFSHATTTLFGMPGTSGSQYSDLTLNYDTGIMGIVFNAHYGYQYVAGPSSGDLTYSDWKIGLTKDLGAGLSVSAAYVDTNAKLVGWAAPKNTTKNMGGATGLVSLTKAF